MRLVSVLLGCICIILPTYAPSLPVTLESAAAAAVYKLIVVEEGVSEGSGTGWLAHNIDGSIVMVTNSHICGTAEAEPEVVLEDGRKLEKRLFDPFSDICVLNVPAIRGEERTAALNLADRISPSEGITVIGHPLGGPRKTTYGYRLGEALLPLDLLDPETIPIPYQDQCIAIIDKCLFLRQSDTFQVEIKPGSSGSPILNFNGEVIGMIWGYSATYSWSLGVRLDQLKRALGH